MAKLSLTLTLSDEEAELLVSTLKVGQRNWIGGGLMDRARILVDYVEKRKDDAVLARGRKRRREQAR